ncbi:hypothetical protein BI364_05060 [Acidihalobacter yilgarnensis]|uniref:Hemerythrin-like domain-containing protein n=1 Tax=Acidihalobacter yilgarnensis TaxID=2819280 RepID=A0A1D8ILU5_9GAMM|nr:hemerythrin domain-containing protein [Acidihalobacter yilgarnensis]AOU97435.1 hypothetical protein BI364_05060 [Acidihalobacter yilgarnensis]
MNVPENQAHCVRKPALLLPAGYESFNRTPDFDRYTMPPGLAESHRTTRGVWAEIVIEHGNLRYEWLDGSGEHWQLAAGEIGVIPADLPHRVEPMSDDTRFYLRLYREARLQGDRASASCKALRYPLDLRQFPRPLREHELFAAFDALSPGQSLSFVDDRDTRALLEHFAASRRHRFLWLPQANTIGRWAVCLYRREPLSSPRVGEVLQADHARIDELLDIATEQMAAGQRGGESLDDLIWGLRRHIRFEEQRFFPLFLSCGGAEPPIRVMLAEHGAIETYLCRLENAPEDAKALAELRQLLGQHNFKEEGVLYPMLNAYLEGRDEPLVEDLFASL